jgi:hypothetical protein
MNVGLPPIPYLGPVRRTRDGFKGPEYTPRKRIGAVVLAIMLTGCASRFPTVDPSTVKWPENTVHFNNHRSIDSTNPTGRVIVTPVPCSLCTKYNTVPAIPYTVHRY